MVEDDVPTHYDGTDEERRALDVFIKLFRATDSIASRTWTPELAHCGVTPTQFGTLETLWHLGPMTPSNLAAKHLMSRNNFTVVIDNLEKLGYVTRMPNREDRRSVTVHLTAAGEELIQRMLPIHVAHVEQEMSVLTSDEQEELGRLLKKLGKGRGDAVDVTPIKVSCGGAEEEPIAHQDKNPCE